MAVKEPKVKLPGVEVRCGNKTLKKYEGVQKLKICGMLVAVVNSAPCGVDLSIKCTRCKQMVRYYLN